MFFTTPLPYAALVAFVALGANLLGTGLLLLIQPASRAVRWHAAFSCWIMAWLLLQGWFTLGLGGPELLRVYGWVVHMMPAFFLASSLVDTRQVRNRTALAVVAFAAVTADLLNPVVGGHAAIVWQAAMWGSGAVLHFRNRSDRWIPDGARPRGEVVLKAILLVVVPFAVVGIIVLSGAFLLYAMPLITIVIQFLIFIGVVHHRFYDIEVRAARTGELAAQAAEQERLALLGELSATLAHEIRNPLTGMRSLTQRLAEDDVDDSRRTRYAGVILGEIERLERIVGNLLGLAQRRAVYDDSPGLTALEPLFEDLALLLEGRARRAQVAIGRDAGGLSAAAPRDALAQALLNLLINAVTHTPPGGTVRLTAALQDERIAIHVCDTGPGIPEADRQQIFEPFHTHGVGAGLGLAVVRRIARELDWDVGVDDAVGGGACFHLRVPGPQPQHPAPAGRATGGSAAAATDDAAARTGAAAGQS